MGSFWLSEPAWHVIQPPGSHGSMLASSCGVWLRAQGCLMVQSAHGLATSMPHSLPLPFLSLLGLVLGSLASLYNHWLPSLHSGDIKHPFLSLCPTLALGTTIRETKPTGCEVHLHGLSLLLLKAVIYQLLDLSHSMVLSCLLSTSLPPV